MKKVILTLGVLALITGVFVYANSTASSTATCEEQADCEPCACTPDCQPGDDWCTCPEE